MKMNAIQWLSMFTIILMIVSCEEINIKTANNDVPVVESYIVPGNKINLKIYKQLVFNSADTTNKMLDGLAVTVTNGVKTIMLNNLGNGEYESSQLIFSETDEYFIDFEYNDKKVSSSTRIPEKPIGLYCPVSTIEAMTFTPGMGMGSERPEPIELSWSNPDAEYHMLVVENIEENPVLINEQTDRPARSFRSMPTQASKQELPPVSFTYYGMHRIILFRLNAEYAALYEKLGSNSLDIEAPPSNIINGLGIFTGINADTILVEVE